MGREAGVLIQFIKYGVCGVAATSVHIVLFHLLAWRMFPALQENDWAVKLFRLTVRAVDDAVRSRNSMINNVITFVFSNLVAYILNILWVFERGRHNLIIELILFYLVSGVSLAASTPIMGYLIKRFGVRTTYAFGACIVVSVMVNFVLRKFVIFAG